jgi:amino-acid N-acetyltransferase
MQKNLQKKRKAAVVRNVVINDNFQFMNATYQVTITKATDDHRDAVVNMLQNEKLPTQDLPASLKNFFVASEKDEVVAAIGLEQYGDCGLLRSMVVREEHRNKKIASILVQRLEEYAKTLGVDCIYLLTETAAPYFERKGYYRINREEVPKQLQASSEFNSVCPVSATVMRKSIK